ncbi:MAG: MFS transporter, partial [Nannocystaceae bacterium]
LGSLYLAQGLPYGFFTQALPALMRARGISLEEIGLTSLLALPWALKFLWAPLVDRVGSRKFGRRRTWIVPLQVLSVATLVALSFIDPQGGLTWILIGVAVINLLAATQDIATDGLAVSILPPSARGLGNGIQVAGYRLGMILGGGVLLIVLDSLGWADVFLLMALTLALSSVPILLYREASEPAEVPATPATPTTTPPLPTLWEALTGLVRRPGMWLWLVALGAYKAGEHFAGGMLRPLLIDLGLTMGEIGWLTGTAGFIAGLLGALAGGMLVNVLGRVRAVVIFGLMQAIAVSLYAFATFGPVDMTELYVLCIVEHFVSGMATVALFTMMMDRCDPKTGGTDYTIQASVVVLASGAASAVSGYSAAALGYTWHFVVAGGACLVTLVPLVAYVLSRRAHHPSPVRAPS